MDKEIKDKVRRDMKPVAADADRERARRADMVRRGEYVTREMTPAAPASYETR
jgi:hypothetical protein